MPLLLRSLCILKQKVCAIYKQNKCTQFTPKKSFCHLFPYATLLSFFFCDKKYMQFTSKNKYTRVAPKKQVHNLPFCLQSTYTFLPFWLFPRRRQE